MKYTINLILSAFLFATQPLCFAAEARAADQRLILETRTFNQLSTAGDALKLMRAFYPQEAVNKVKESMIKSGLAETASLPKIRWNNNVAKIEGLEVKVTNMQPFEVLINGKFWRFKKGESLDKNYTELFNVVSGGKASSHALLSAFMPEAKADVMTAVTNFASFAGIAIAVMTIASITWPSWVVLGTAFAFGVGMSALIEYLLPNKPKVRVIPSCTDTGVTIEFSDSHVKFVVVGSPEKIKSMTVIRPDVPDRVIDLTSEAEAQFKAMTQVCKSNPQDIENLRKIMEKKDSSPAGAKDSNSAS